MKILSVILGLLFWHSVVLGVEKTTATQDNTIYIVSEEWDLATKANGFGLYWDILKEVYRSQGYDIKFSTSSYSRSVSHVKQGKADAWVGSAMDEVEDTVYPSFHIDVDPVYALVSKETVDNWNGQDTLAGKNVGWVKDYEYDADLAVDVHVHEFVQRKVGLARLESGKLDAILDARHDLERAIMKHNFDMTNYQLVHVLNQKLYMGFANTKRGKTLAEAYDNGIQELKVSGRLRELFSMYTWTEYSF